MGDCALTITSRSQAAESLSCADVAARYLHSRNVRLCARACAHECVCSCCCPGFICARGRTGRCCPLWRRSTVAQRTCMRASVAIWRAAALIVLPAGCSYHARGRLGRVEFPGWLGKQVLRLGVHDAWRLSAHVVAQSSGNKRNRLLRELRDHLGNRVSGARRFAAWCGCVLSPLITRAHTRARTRRPARLALGLHTRLVLASSRAAAGRGWRWCARCCWDGGLGGLTPRV